MRQALKSLVWLRTCNSVGSGCLLDGPPWIENRGYIKIGSRVFVSSNPTQTHLFVAEGGRLEIGRNVHIGQGAAINATARIVVGEGTRLAAFVVIADTDFHAADDFARKPEPRPVLIGRNVTVGARSTILAGSVIGDGAHVHAGSVVRGVVPEGAAVRGVLARRTEPVDRIAQGLRPPKLPQ